MKKPWNLFNAPVYSLATEGDRINMNVCTYVTAVSLDPKQYAIAVYQGTQTLKNLSEDHTPILQLLSKRQIHLINALGRKSGASFDKARYLEKKSELMEWKGRPVLKHSAAFIALSIRDKIVSGDHVTFLFDVTAYRSLSTDVLMLDDLRERKMIRN